MPYYRRAAKRPSLWEGQVLYPAESIGVLYRGELYIGRSTSFLATTTEGMRKVTPHMQPDAGGGRWQQRRKQLLFWRSCMSPGDNCRVTQHRNCRGNSKQHVRTQPVCHELRRHRPYSRSYQDLLSYISQPQRRRQDLSPHPSYS